MSKLKADSSPAPVPAPSARELEAAWFQTISFPSDGALPHYMTPIAAFGTFDPLSTGEESFRRCARMLIWFKAQIPAPLAWADDAMAEIKTYDARLLRVSSAAPGWTMLYAERTGLVRNLEIKLESCIREHLVGSTSK